MLVVLTGAFRNVGDHLIGDRAISLLKEFVDEEIINLNRNAIKESDYEIMNQARAVILCGGPAYQREMYPKVYSIDLTKIKTRVIPFGLGWKGNLGQSPKEFNFSDKSIKFIKQIHDMPNSSSCRDNYTVEVLKDLGVDNVQMTGCPAWYDLGKINEDLVFSETKQIIFSDPAKLTLSRLRAIAIVAKNFPDSEKILTLHHGILPNLRVRGIMFATGHVIQVIYAKLYGYKIISLAADLAKMKSLYDNCDLHIGFRVHAHIYCLSRRKPSLILSEDSRGIGQSIALANPVLNSNSKDFLNELNNEIKSLKEKKASYFDNTISNMREKFIIMKKFLASI